MTLGKRQGDDQPRSWSEEGVVKGSWERSTARQPPAKLVLLSGACLVGAPVSLAPVVPPAFCPPTKARSEAAIKQPSTHTRGGTWKRDYT
jgi:hypothetical protein